ncbi:MAG: HD domain-containing protein [Sulfurovaceae bacterium]
MQLPSILYSISSALKCKNAKAIVVGGSVRDYFMGMEVKDYDIEVYGICDMDALENILSSFGKVNIVGKSYGILKLSHNREEYDISLPRTETKIGNRHKDFDITCDSSMSYEDAFKRRDFTINAVGYDIESKNFIDPFGGIEDINKKCLRHINDDTFVEDPLRVYRAVQFTSRFGFTLHDSTFELCQKMVDNNMLEHLPKERVYAEFKKMLLKSKYPSRGFQLAKELRVLRYYPELKALVGLHQSPIYHPEGDVWTHTMMALDEMAKLKTGDDKKDEKLLWAILCHDFGKTTHTQIENDKITAIGHEKAGVEVVYSFMSRLTNEHKLIMKIEPLVRYHLAPSQLYKQQATIKAIRRLSTKVNIEELVLVAKADFLGRLTPEAQNGVFEAGEWLLAESKKIGVSNKAPTPLLQGRDLIKLGLQPSPAFKNILHEAYEAQIEGIIATHNEALAWARKLLNIEN